MHTHMHTAEFIRSCSLLGHSFDGGSFIYNARKIGHIEVKLPSQPFHIVKLSQSGS
jgi:hypothetical protein